VWLHDWTVAQPFAADLHDTLRAAIAAALDVNTT
jgi:hypothetical protein